MKKKMGRPAGDAAGLGGSAVLADGQDRRRPSAAGGKSGQLFAVLLVHGHCEMEKWSWRFKPFAAPGFLKVVSIAVLLGQGVLLWFFIVRKRRLGLV